MEEDEKTRDEALKLKELSESYHAQVVELSDRAQETHEEMLKYFQKIDEIRSKADEAHADFIKTGKRPQQKHEEVKTVLKEIRAKNKSLDKVKAKERHKESQISREEKYPGKRDGRRDLPKIQGGKKTFH